jgi:F0F1-type ATP synthase beta subunit
MEEFTGRPGKHISLATRFDACYAIVSGRADELPERAFFIVGELEGML